MPLPNTVYGYEVRQPFDGELGFFKQNAHIAGMAAEDGRITINPFSSLSDDEKTQVAKNEAARLFIRQKNIPMGFDLTEDQIKSFKGTAYDVTQNPSVLDDLKASIIGRALSGDPSSGTLTKQQKAMVGWLRPQIEARR